MLKWLKEYSATVKRNFVCNLIDGALYSFAISFISLSAVTPVFVKKIGGSNISVGLLPVFWTVGFNFPQILIANYSSKQPYKKKLLLRTSLLQRVPWLLISFTSLFFIGKIESNIGLVIFFILFALAAVAGSLNLPGWFDLIAKLTPIHLRGRLFAFRSITGGALGIIGGWIVSMILSRISFPENYAILYLIAFIITMCSYIFLTLLKEDSPDDVHEEKGYKDFFRGLPRILKEEKNFRNYLVADALLVTALMADVFYSINALSRFSLPDSYVGEFTIIIMGSLILGNLFFGYMADHFGHKLNLLIASLSTFSACFIALNAYSLNLYMIAFAGSAFTTSLQQVSRLPIIAELSAENNRQTYIALTNMITSPFSLSGIIGGWIANHYGYSYIFIISMVCAFSASIWLIAMVKEPRKLNLDKTR
ncbi:MAG: MFS transporter [Bacteroidota bacterium]|nr:MFS transporter [Bacteroidota bacterium]